MKLTELIHEIWKDEEIEKMGLRKHEVDTIVKVVINQIIKNLFKYKVVKLRGLFTIRLKKVKGRKINHVDTKEEVKVNDYYKLNVVPSSTVKKKMKDIVD